MKLVKNVVFAVVLVSALAVNTPAGDIQIPAICGQQCSTPPQTVQPKSLSTPIEGTTKPAIDTTTGQQSEISYETFDFLLYEALRALLTVF
jgi:hypothetical protein